MNKTLQLVGLPWQLAKRRLQAAYIPFRVTIGASYNKFFTVAQDGFYVARVIKHEDIWDILIYPPMIYSNFEQSEEVQYADEVVKQ